jgi:uncharacterized protein (TIGR03000 family)
VAATPARPALTAAEREAVERLLREMRGGKGKGKGKGGTPDRGDDGEESDVSSTTSARITVRLPASAALYVDGERCPLTSGTRTFTTAALQPGREYTYTLEAEYQRDGQTRRESRQVRFSAGQDVSVSFGGAATATASR